MTIPATTRVIVLWAALGWGCAEPAPLAEEAGAAALEVATPEVIEEAVPEPTPAGPGPEWVTESSRVEDGVYYGVGMVRGIRTPALARTTADNRARAEIGKLVTGETGFSTTLYGVVIVDHWLAEDGRLYALARYEPAP